MNEALEAIARLRLLNQSITSPGRRRPADVVEWLGAVQAQEYEPAKWALGLRMHDAARDAEVERAFDRGHILRTHVMRPTWHFVTPRDIRWLLELTAPRVQRILLAYSRRLGMDAAMLTRGIRVIERALRDRQYLTRRELGERLRRARLEMSGVRLAQLTAHAELEAVICSGPRRLKDAGRRTAASGSAFSARRSHGSDDPTAGRRAPASGRLQHEFTYALLDERAPAARRLRRDEALAELCRRYFTSHGPATIRDFVWWSGLTTTDAKRGLEICRARRQDVGGKGYWSAGAPPARLTRDYGAHLLPIYDEYLIAYRDRDAVPHGPAVVASARQSVSFQHALLIGGQVAGTWRTTRRPRVTSIQATALRRLTAAERRAVADAVERYQQFRGIPLEISFT